MYIPKLLDNFTTTVRDSLIISIITASMPSMLRSVARLSSVKTTLINRLIWVACQKVRMNVWDGMSKGKGG